MNTIAKLDWNVLDEAHQKMETRMLDWCKLVSEMEERQQDIADRYGLSQSAVGRMSEVGKNYGKFIHNANNPLPNLPTGWGGLYELCDLNKTDIKRLCKHGVPTRSMIRSRKVELGLLPPPPSKQLEDTGHDIDWGLVPKSDMDGLSEFAVKDMQKIESKLTPLLSGLNKGMQKNTLTALVRLANYLNRYMKARIPNLVNEANRERAEELDRREKRLMVREKAVAQGIDARDKKLIQQCLHPDKAPPGMQERYAKAFDAFRKVA